MTEKRFTMNEDGYIWDNKKPISQETVLIRLNALHEENEQLKSKNRGLQSELQIFKEDATHSNLQINKLADENEQLKKQLSDDFNQSNCITVQKSIVSDLKKENEELKEKIDKLEGMLINNGLM